MDVVSASRPALLASVRAALARSVDGFVDRFYADLESRPGPGAVLGRLDAPEVTRLKARQAEHLLDVLDPDQDERTAFVRAREIGRVHAMVGVDIGWYAEAMATHHAQIFDLVGRLPEVADQAWLYSTLAQRLTRDLQGALAGYRDVDAAAHRAMVRVHDTVSSAGTVPDLVHGVLEALTGVDGVAAGFFGRPDTRDVFRFEMGVGSGAEEFMAEVERKEPLTITVLKDDVRGGGPSGRSWRSRQIERSDSYLTDPATAPWHALGGRLGWRSSVSVPICTTQGEVRALLSLYSVWPGFFAPPEREAMLLQVRQVVERALAGLESRGTVASGVRAYSTRTSYLAKLRRGDVRMVYQPIAELATGRVTKVEALARLVDADRLVLPGEFLPAFGDDDLVRLFDLGLDQALDAAREWGRAGRPVGVSLNLPGVSTHDERYVTIVERALERHRADPAGLTLELLETGGVDGRPRWRNPVLEQLKALGVRLAQDDLGSGYSSLLRLRHFAFDDVKLDQSLVRGQEFDPRGALNFIQPLTDLAHSMGLSVVVEGLENDGLVEAAYMLGADAGQGYAISPPLGREELVGWVAGFTLGLEPANPATHLGGLAAHVAWEHRAWSSARGPAEAARLQLECPLDRYIARTGDPHGHVGVAHAEVHRAALAGRGSAEHMRWWRVLTKLVAGLAA